jgi:hypothetical protein
MLDIYSRFTLPNLLREEIRASSALKFSILTFENETGSVKISALINSPFFTHSSAKISLP